MIKIECIIKPTTHWIDDKYRIHWRGEYLVISSTRFVYYAPLHEHDLLRSIEQALAEINLDEIDKIRIECEKNL